MRVVGIIITTTDQWSEPEKDLRSRAEEAICEKSALPEFEFNRLALLIHPARHRIAMAINEFTYVAEDILARIVRRLIAIDS